MDSHKVVIAVAVPITYIRVYILYSLYFHMLLTIAIIILLK